MGARYGGVVPIWTNMPARTFGAGSVGRALGVTNPLHIPITATSAPLAGYISDTTGSYDGVFWLYGGCCAWRRSGPQSWGQCCGRPTISRLVLDQC